MELAFVASQNKGVKYLLVAWDVVSLFVRVQKIKTKHATATLQASKKIFRKYFGFIKEQKIGVCKEKYIEIYS